VYASLSIHDDFARSAFSPPTGASARFASSVHNELYRQLHSSMLPKLLRFTDRSSMAFSREVRLPFLDHRIAEYLSPSPKLSKSTAQQQRLFCARQLKAGFPTRFWNATTKRDSRFRNRERTFRRSS
jgi:hypothetical protein